MADLAVLQVKFTADTSAMDRAFDSAERRVKAFQATFKALNPSLDVDTKGFMSGMAAAEQAASKAADHIEREFARARAAAAAPIKLHVEATGTNETISELTGVNRAREQVDGKNAALNVKANGTSETVAELTGVNKAREQVDGKNAGVNVKASGSAETIAELGLVERMVNHLNGQKAKVDVDASTAKAVPAIMGDATAALTNFKTVAALIGASTVPLMIGAIGGLVGAAASAAAGVGALAGAIGTGLVGAGAVALGSMTALGAGAYAAGGLIANAAANAFGAEKGFASLGAEVKAAGDQVKTANELIAKMPAGTDAAAAAADRLRIAQEYQAQATQNQVDWFNKYGAASNQLVESVNTLRLGFTQMAGDMSGQLLPVMTEFVNFGITMLPMLEGPLQTIVDAVNAVGDAFLETVSSAQSMQNIQNILDTIGASAGAALGILADGFTVALYAVQPLLPVIVDVNQQLSELSLAAAQWVQTAQGQQTIVDIWNVLFDYGGRLVQVVADLGVGFYNLAESIAQAGMVDQMMSGLEAAVGAFRELTAAGTESRAVIDNFMTVSGPILTALGGLVAAVTQGFLDLANGIVTATDASTGMNILEQIFTRLQEVVPVVVDMLVESFREVGPLIPDLVLNLAKLANVFVTATPQLIIFLETLNGAMELFTSLPEPVQAAVAQFAALGFMLTSTGIPAVAGMVSNVAIMWKIFGGFGVVSAASSILSAAGAAFAAASEAAMGLALALDVALPLLGAIAAIGAIAILIAVTFDMSAAQSAYQESREAGNSAGDAFADGFVAGMQGVPILGSVVSWLDENVAKPIDDFISNLQPSTSIWDVLTGEGEAADNPILGTLIEWWGAITDWLSSLVPPVSLMDVIAGIGEATGITDLLSTVQGAIQPVIDWVSGAWEQVKSTAQAAWNALPQIVSTALQSLATSATIMLGALLVPILAGWEQLKSLTQIAWDAVGLIISGAVALWGATVGPAIQALIAVVSAAWTGLSTATQVAWDAVGTVIATAVGLWQTYVQPVIDALVAFIESEWTMISTQAQAAWDAIGQIISTAVGLWQTYVQPVIDAIVSVVQTAWTTIQTVTETVWNTIGTIIQTAVSLWQTYIQPVIDVIVSIVQTAWDTISTATQTAWDAIGTVISTAVAAWEGYIQPVLDAIVTAVQTAWDTISTAATDAWNAIGQIVLDNWETIKTGVTAATEELPTIVQTAWDAITQGVSDFASSFGDAVAEAFGTALQKGLNAIADFIDAIASALDTIGVSLDIDLAGASGALRGATGYARGGVAYAAGGLGTQGRNARMHVWNEGMGNEAYIAQRGPRNKQIQYLSEAASWFDMSVVPGKKQVPAVGQMNFCDGGCAHAQGGYVSSGCSCAQKFAGGGIPVVFNQLGATHYGWQPYIAERVHDIEAATGTTANTYYGHGEPGGSTEDLTADFWGGCRGCALSAEQGNAVANYVLSKYSSDLMYMIAQGSMWRGGWYPWPEDPHYDHTHVSWGGSGGGTAMCDYVREAAKKAIEEILPDLGAIMGDQPILGSLGTFVQDEIIPEIVDYIVSLIPICGTKGAGEKDAAGSDKDAPSPEKDKKDASANARGGLYRAGIYAKGGVIPGAPGEDLLVLAEPGEAILPSNAVGAFKDLATAISTAGGMIGGIGGAGAGGSAAPPGEDPATKAIVQATLDQTTALVNTDLQTASQVVNMIMQQTGMDTQNAQALLAQLMDQTTQLLGDSTAQTQTMLQGITEQTTTQTTAFGEHLTTLGDTVGTKLDDASTTITTGFTDGLTQFSSEMLPPIQEIPTAIETHMGGVNTGVQDLVGVERQAWGLATGGKVGAGHKPVRLYGEGAGTEWFITDALGARGKNAHLLADAAAALGYRLMPAHQGGTGDGGGWDLVGSSGKVMTIGSGVSGRVTEAMNAWNQVQSVKLLPHYGSSPNVSVSLGDPGSGAIGVTYSTGQIILDPNYLAGEQGLALAAHEFGHALGLGHVDDPSSLMNPYLSPGVTGITGDASAAVQGLWGAFGATPRVPASFHRGGYVRAGGFGLLARGERVLSPQQTSLLEETLQEPAPRGGGSSGDVVINFGDVVINGNTSDPQATAEAVRREQQKMLEQGLLRLADRGNSMRTQSSVGWS